MDVVVVVLVGGVGWGGVRKMVKCGEDLVDELANQHNRDIVFTKLVRGSTEFCDWRTTAPANKGMAKTAQ